MKEMLNEQAEAEDEIPSGWERDTEPAIAPICSDIGKRHKWRGGNVCIVCGIEREKVTPGATGERRPRTPKASSSNEIAQLLSMAWAITGSTLAKHGDERLVPVGNVMQIQSSMAGPRLDRALQRTPIYKYLTTGKTGIIADLFPVIAPPLLVGLIANLKSDRAKEAARPLVLTILLPVLIEASKQQEQSKELLESLNDISSEQLDQASALVDEILGIGRNANTQE
jgi:hypothetical protein